MWDAYVTKLKGYANLEKHRERFMAKKGLRLLRKYERVLILVEYERLEGVAREIEKLASEPWDPSEDDDEDEVDEAGDKKSEEEDGSEDADEEIKDPDKSSDPIPSTFLPDDPEAVDGKEDQ